MVDDDDCDFAAAKCEQPREQGFPSVVVVFGDATAERGEVIENEHVATLQLCGDGVLAIGFADVHGEFRRVEKVLVVQPDEAGRGDADGGDEPWGIGERHFSIHVEQSAWTGSGLPFAETFGME